MKSSDSTSSSISTKEIEAVIDKLMNSNYRPATKRNYQCVWRAFNKFFIRLDSKPKSWGDHITLFVGYLVDCNKQLCMIQSYRLAIKAVLLDNDIELDTNQYLLNSLMHACHLENDRVCHRYPIQRGHLLVILKHIDRHYYYATLPQITLQGADHNCIFRFVQGR